MMKTNTLENAYNRILSLAKSDIGWPSCYDNLSPEQKEFLDYLIAEIPRKEEARIAEQVHLLKQEAKEIKLEVDRLEKLLNEKL